MKCPFCQNPETKVIETREIHNGNIIRRRRKCIKCKKRFTTREKYEEIVKLVIKNDDTREEFDIEKLKKGIMRACEKRPISAEQIENITNRIEKEISLIQKKEIKSKTIGEFVMKELKTIDDVAYIRFASVYKKFKDVAEFAAEIEKIKGKE